MRRGGQGSSLAGKFSDMEPVEPVENIDDAPGHFDDSRIDSEGEQDEMVTPSSSGLSPIFHFSKSASNKLSANVAKGFPAMFKPLK